MSRRYRLPRSRPRSRIGRALAIMRVINLPRMNLVGWFFAGRSPACSTSPALLRGGVPESAAVVATAGVVKAGGNDLLAILAGLATVALLRQVM